MYTQYLHYIHTTMYFPDLLPTHWYQLLPTERTCFTLLFSDFIKEESMTFFFCLR
jgi:hypothetical protein